MAEQPTWETDFRWRRVRVTSQLLSSFLRGEMRDQEFATRDAPADLLVVGLTEVRSGPDGYYEFIIWSASFDPAPNDGERPAYPIPLAEFTYLL